VKLRHLDDWNEARRACAAGYSGALAGIPGLRVPGVAPDREHVFHLYVIRTEDRDALREHLSSLGIQTGLHYPVPLHLQAAFANGRDHTGEFPVSERWARTGLSLPLFAELTGDQLSEVIQGVKSFGLVDAPQSNNH
jgi:dTDP-4-amino-4,6-dideoxygalactose transaminase